MPREPSSRPGRELVFGALLEARSSLPPREWTEEELEQGRDVTEEEAMAAAAQVMLQARPLGPLGI